jgi:glutathione synthase/RimK-type ligase-like ATP-grasp enzyme
MILILLDSIKSPLSKKNYLSKLKKRLMALRVGIEIKKFEGIELFVEKNNIRALIDGKPIAKYDTIFFRRVGKNRNLAFIVSNLARKQKIPFFDNLYQYSNEPGKLKQTFWLAFHNISVPKTFYSPTYNSRRINSAVKFLGFPMVIKASVSKRGKGVFLANNKKELKNILAKTKGIETIFQEFIPNTFEYRFLILGNKIAVAEKKIRTKKKEFRNNVCLGAKEEFLSISDVPLSAKKEALRAAKIANIQIAGVDIVLTPQGKQFIFEVNRAPALTNDERISNEILELARFLANIDKDRAN